MSWAGLSSNQLVSNNNINDAVTNGVFTFKPGQSAPSNNKCITRSEANTMLNITAITSDNKLAKKSEFVSSVTYYQVVANGSYASDYVGGSDDASCYLSIGYDGVGINSAIYTTNSSGILNIGDIGYFLSGGVYYTFVGIDEATISYYEGATRIWLTTTQFDGSIVTKGNC